MATKSWPLCINVWSFVNFKDLRYIKIIVLTSFRKPAELKHINKRRKRNQQGLPQ